MREFLESALLYEKRVIFENYGSENANYYDPKHFSGQTFDYFCEKEQKITTFELALIYDFPKWTYSQLSEDVFKDDKLNYTFPTICSCLSCNEEKIYFLLNVFSDKPISDIVANQGIINFTERSISDIPDTNIFIQKVGIYPELKVKTNKVVAKFLDKESNIFYYKGLKALNQNLGVGALSYFRRIIERELLHIIQEIRNLPDSDKGEIQKLIDAHNKNNSISSIYENIFEFLPASLKELDYNPIKLLYSQTSEGLHRYSENESFEKAQKILALLEFVIIKIHEEKSIIKDIKQIVKDLRPDQ